MAHIVITGASAGGNDSLLLQNALDALGGTGGGTVTIVDGTWTLTSTLEISSNTHLQLGLSATLQKAFNGPAQKRCLTPFLPHLFFPMRFTSRSPRRRLRHGRRRTRRFVA